jgi:hypothetical protein
MTDEGERLCRVTFSCQIAESLAEFQDGGLSPMTRGRNGEVYFELYRLRQFLVGRLDFDKVARERGTEELRQICGGEVSLSTIDVLIDSVFGILHQVIRQELN